jgi:iron complex outermembrane recepter protein
VKGQTIAVLLAGAALGAVSPAVAQTAPEEATTPAEQQAANDQQPAEMNDIVVTATRSSQAISRVPISIAAFTQERLDQQGVRRVDDVTRLVPGVDFSRSGYGLTTNVAIRGVSSQAGAATTGIYIDDTPIQVRAIGNSSGNAYPAIFDLERVEVLRGPQGTLFGAGSQGGTIRFISPSPNLDRLSVYGRGELAFTKNGEPSYEVGVAAGAPILEDVLGFRASASYRRDGGWVDRVPYPSGQGRDSDSNTVETRVARAALGWQAAPGLMITPSIYYQELTSDDTAAYWVRVGDRQISDRNSQRYINGNHVPSTNRDWFVLPALKVRLDLDNVEIASDTSYFARNESGIYDYVAFMNNIFGFGNDPTPVLATPGYVDIGNLWNRQRNFTQEVRIRSTDTASRLSWLVGVFYTHARQRSHQDIADPFFNEILAPSGLTVEDLYGIPLLPGGIAYVDNFRTVDKQIAGFGEVTYEVLDGLKLTAGVRVARTTLDFATTRDGPAQGGPGSDSGTQKETPVTPKFSIAYQADPDNLFYATAAKGFRVGGVNRAIPTNAQCGPDLESVGYADGAPGTYKSDTVWSYEAGTKNRIGPLRLAASAYLIKWKDIIDGVSLPNCGFAFTDNLGSATIRGFDLSVDLQAMRGLLLSAQVGYTKGTFDETLIRPGGTATLVTVDYTVGGAPWTITVSGQYDFAATAALDGYLRFDFNHRTRQNGLSATFDPNSISFDPTIPRNPAVSDLRLRAGLVTKSGVDLSLFLNNALNSDPLQNVDHVTTSGQIYTADAIRPINGGITLAFRY